MLVSVIFCIRWFSKQATRAQVRVSRYAGSSRPMHIPSWCIFTVYSSCIRTPSIFSSSSWAFNLAVSGSSSLQSFWWMAVAREKYTLLRFSKSYYQNFYGGVCCDDSEMIIFSSSQQKHVYSLEAFCWDVSIEYPQRIFLWRDKKNYPRIITKYTSLTHCSRDTPKKCNWQTVQTQIRCRRMQCLIRVSTVCK